MTTELKTLRFKRGIFKQQLTNFEKYLQSLNKECLITEDFTNLKKRLEKVELIFDPFEQFQNDIELLTFENEDEYTRECNERESFENSFYLLTIDLYRVPQECKNYLLNSGYNTVHWSLKFDNLSTEEFDTYWKACRQFRMAEIKTMDSTASILDKWPFYKTPSGFRLIDMDFDALYTTGDGLLSKCNNKREQFLTSENNVKDKSIKGVLDYIQKHEVDEIRLVSISFKMYWISGILCLVTIIAVGLSREVDVATKEPRIQIQKAHLLGSKECTFGPSYWCQNLTNAANCRATKHCIQTVWLHQKLPPDQSSICETCLEMVKEARDQLLSNETEEEIKEVFEGSCNLIPVKIVAKECCKLVDEFAPELIDTLASQMNPQIVCSVAGLCNNERVRDLLDQESKSVSTISKPEKTVVSDCEGCFAVMDLIENKYRKASRNEVLQSFLQVCGRTGSFSDACSNIIVTYFNEIYKHLNENLNSQDFCFMSGECSELFHSHVNVEITHFSKIGILPVGKDNLPCDLCKQLVKHLQNVLIANTTEEEFHKVLLGVCKQTKSFKDECISLVDQYYPMIYNFIVSELNATVLCSLADLCPGPGITHTNVPLTPLLPVETVQNYHASQSLGGISPELIQLPIERIMPPALTMLGNTELCTFCQYFLHYVQQAITDPVTEERVKEVVDKACDMLPSSIRSTCENFVKDYGPAFIAIFAQEIDPSIVCPKLSLCPSNDLFKIQNVEVFMQHNKGDKPNCPLCLFAITSLEELINDKKTEDSIKRGLQSLCSHFKGNLAVECSDFVNTYTDEIVKLIIKEFTPQQVCVTLKLCEDTDNEKVPKLPFGGEIETNVIFDETIDGKVVTDVQAVNEDICFICEFLMSELQNTLKNNATEEEIKELLNKICNDFSSKYIKTHCFDFINKYEDVVIQLIINSLSPGDVCKAIKLCKVAEQALEVNDLLIDNVEPESVTEVSVSSPQCMFCKLVMKQIEKILAGKINEDDVIKAVETVCEWFPSKKQSCDKFIEEYGKEIIEFLKFASDPSEFCSIIGLCSTHKFQLEIRKCAVCEVAVDIMAKILQNPNVDKAIEHVLEKTCRAFPPKNQEICRTMIEMYGEKIFQMLSSNLKPVTICQEIKLCAAKTYRPNEQMMLGKQKCTRGPGYWCLSEQTAVECHAIDHCKKKVWKQQNSP
ncbi:hypothetical protein RN001_004978 [Aquatica leii]|uniref:Pulmonary surfactant-associated protein B n=1 Tax=Aquatica leii TaxID=1421715 RepID=A0AAN7PZ71_9COLE|nr:hypothetical protein RN001_004978 [Aquatica leii]